MNVMNLTSGQRERLRVAMLDMTKAEQRSVRASLTVGGPLAMQLIGSPACDADEPVGRVRRSSPRSAAISAALTGRPLSEAHRAAISAGMKGKPKSDSHRAAISAAMAGKPRKPQTEEHRAAISEGLTGKPKTDAHREAISVGMKGKPRPDLKGKPLTEAHRAAISAAQMGKTRQPLSQEQREAISAAQKGRPLSEAHRAALKVAQNRPEVNAKRSATWRAKREVSPSDNK